MKKVRYAAGAIGALGAMPALGLVMPPATAATHAQARTGKTVSLSPLTPRVPDAPCNARIAQSQAGDFFARIIYSRDIGCIGEVSGIFGHHTNTGWWMRVRSYVNNNLVSTRYNKNGTIARSSISFSSFPHHTGISQVCEAMIRSSAPGTVRFGPICERTGF
jgi:hypothetical protein